MYSGGLGIYNGTWDQFGGRDFASNPGLATREEQIIVAERIRADGGDQRVGLRAHPRLHPVTAPRRERIGRRAVASRRHAITDPGRGA